VAIACASAETRQPRRDSYPVVSTVSTDTL
jgi:hypothetical protein